MTTSKYGIVLKVQILCCILYFKYVCSNLCIWGSISNTFSEVFFI